LDTLGAPGEALFRLSVHEIAIIESTFVDDEAMYLAAPSPEALFSSVSQMLSGLTKVFSKYGFIINWNKKKTEAIIVLRGKSAAIAGSMLADNSGGLSFPLPPSCSNSLTIVQSYKHVGTIICSNLSPVLDARNRCSEAMSAYKPLVTKVFDCVQVPLVLKMSLACSLVFTRLFFGIHTWHPAKATQAYCILNCTYMRILRRIVGQSRFASGAQTDYEIRKLLGAPSVECVACQARLRYVARLAAGGPDALIGMLALQNSSSCVLSKF
jgi:hypothetical protein